MSYKLYKHDRVGDHVTTNTFVADNLMRVGTFCHTQYQSILLTTHTSNDIYIYIYIYI